MQYNAQLEKCLTMRKQVMGEDFESKSFARARKTPSLANAAYAALLLIVGAF